MKMKDIAKGIAIAGTVGLLFSSGCGSDSDTSKSQTQASVKCQGINSCKGTSDCAGAANDCKGLNGCAGTGYLLVETDKECADKGGKVI
ncbi:MAG: hypothetical protein H6707_09625 [Deltaproteobacteria bacterium]|nr:hypothetical protein [Deltaproteobacteria bacterium]